ncbi:hypothetical protein FOA43_001172 [Brettanomyces nanus]|uniref:Uncharacterized protein n=1 Tax=Eeniella nana TaxID=13502 RepID=A0A875RTU3_EENNA|nr:uncharacterized protein FOA43_001172 [Brettanomyces nanus]QPG73857.1 hypothetical protein FOA43_001172 [Brettanomyces nanus]
MTLSERQEWILGGSLVLGGLALYIQSSKHPLIKPTKVVYPPKNGGSPNNRIYQIIRDPSELDPLLVTKAPLLLNFVRLGEPASSKLTISLQKIVSTDMVKENKAVSMVSVECDGTENIPLAVKYAIKEIPSILCLDKQLPAGNYVDLDLNRDPQNTEVKVEQLTQWVREHAKDITDDQHN